jgi:hypothetical protein
MLRWFPRFQVATTCFSCSPPGLNLLVTSFIFCIHVKQPLPPGDNPIAVNNNNNNNNNNNSNNNWSFWNYLFSPHARCNIYAGMIVCFGIMQWHFFYPGSTSATAVFSNFASPLHAGCIRHDLKLDSGCSMWQTVCITFCQRLKLATLKSWVKCAKVLTYLSSLTGKNDSFLKWLLILCVLNLKFWNILSILIEDGRPSTVILL